MSTLDMNNTRVKRDSTKDFDYTQIAANAASHLINETAPNGYIPAAQDYSWYKPHWFRDSSWVAISLLAYYNFDRRRNAALASRALETAGMIIDFNIGSVGRFLGNISRLEVINYEDPEFFNLKYHMPSRCSADHGFFKSSTIDDTLENNVKHSWLMQYDSIPLILLSLQKKQDYVGLDEHERHFLNTNIETMLKYLGKIYITECPSMWEIDIDMLHFYDVAAIHASFKFAKKLAEECTISMSIDDIDRIERGYYKGGTLGFIKKYFLNDGVLYSEKKPFAELPEIQGGFDGSEIFAFNYFGIDSDSLGNDSVMEHTIQKMEKSLLGSNILPIRFTGDIYFTGGRWLLLGLEFANYYAKHGNIGRAKLIVDYIESKYRGDYPEQEILDPANPSIDQGNYYALNGHMPIQKLAWSYASMIIASTALADSSDSLLRKG